MKILVIGNIGAGKTFLAKKLVTAIPRSILIPLDMLRIMFGDGTISKEYTALSAFTSLFEKKETTITILEFTGAGPHKHAVLNAIRRGKDFTIVIYVKSQPASCKQRIIDRVWDIPYPWSSPAERFIEPIHEELEQNWNQNFWKGSNIQRISYDFEQSFEWLLREIERIATHEQQEIKIENEHKQISILRIFDLITDLLRSLVMLYSPFQALITFGSYARNTHTLSSDIDYAIILKENVNTRQIRNLIVKMFNYHDINVRLTLEFDDKTIYYLNSKKVAFPYHNFKIEIYLIPSINAIEKYLVGSRLTNKDIPRVVIYSKQSSLNDEVRLLLKARPIKGREKELLYHINRSIESFTLACSSSQKSDYYQFYFHLNILFHHILVLWLFIIKGNVEYSYLPRYAHYYFSKKQLQELSELMEFPAISYHNRIETLKRFQEELIKVVERVGEKFEVSLDTIEINDLLEEVVETAKYRNFRDIAVIDYNQLQAFKLYRSAALSVLPEQQLREILSKLEIKAIIDLRGKDEIEKEPYNMNLLSEYHIQYYNIPFSVKEPDIKDPIEYNEKTKRYYQTIIEDWEVQIKQVFLALAKSETPILVHCNAGKDRTGMIIALIYKLVNIPEEKIIREYLFSQRNTKPEFIQALLTSVKKQGGIQSYLERIGVSKGEIEKIREKLLRKEAKKD